MRAFSIGLAVLWLSAASAQAQTTLAIATGGTGGIYYPLGGGLANMLPKKLSDTQVTAEVTGGSVDKGKLLETGQANLGLMSADVVSDALRGQGKFKTAIPLRTIVTIYSIKLIDIDHLLAPIVKKYGQIFVPSVIKAGSYSGQATDNMGLAAWNQVLATDKMSDDMAYAITKAVFENKADLVAVHKEALNIELSTQTEKESPAPYHPGALKYLKERGAR